MSDVFTKLAQVLELAADELDRKPTRVEVEVVKTAAVAASPVVARSAKLAQDYRDRTGESLTPDVLAHLDDPKVAEAVEKLAGHGAPTPLGGPSEVSAEVVPESRAERRDAAYGRFGNFLTNHGSR